MTRAPRRAPRATRVARAALLSTALALAACSSAPKPPPDLTPELERIAATGYVPERRYETSALHEVWEQDELKVDVSFIAPRAPGRYPLVVYLPGLGESALAGALWRTAWAQAGYAVLAVQTMELTEQVWASQLAHEGEFRALAKSQFSAPEARFVALRFALEELKRRADAGDARYAVADASAIVLAGFDLGAQTASLAVGEKLGDRDWRLADVKIRAVVALSPFYDGAQADAAARFAAIGVPMLFVTGTADSDLFSLMRSPAQRQIPFGAMPTGDKYLLVLQKGSHSLLAGDGLYPPGFGESTARGAQGASGRRGRRGGGQGGSLRLDDAEITPRFDTHGALRLDESDEAPGAPARRSESRRGAEAEGAMAGLQSFDLLQVAAVRDVSTAFLDATVKQRRAARDWLGQSAKDWLGESAVLKSK
jgi:dienelactone hydrolase